MPLLWVDNFPYGTAVTPGAWSGSLPALQPGGRNGSKRVRWTPGHGLVRGGGGNVVTVGGAYIVESSNVIIPYKKVVESGPADTLSTGSWLQGVAWNGWAYCGVIATQDGALHVMRGGAFEDGPQNIGGPGNTPGFSIIASSAPGVISPRGWYIIESTFVSDIDGRVIVNVNGNEVIDYIGYTKSEVDFCFFVQRKPFRCPDDSPFLWPDECTEVVFGAGTRGGRLGGAQGWTGYLDSAWAFNDDTIRGDIAVDTLVPIGAGALSQSAIVGAAPTRWQSVDDILTPDNGATAVMFDLDRPKTDEYLVAPLNRPAAEIFGVYAQAIARRSPAGSAQIRLGVSDGASTATSALVKVRRSTMQSLGVAFPTNPAGGPWTAADCDDLRVRVTRET